MNDNKRQIEYALRIIVEAENDESDEVVLFETSSDRPFQSIHAGDAISPKGFIPQNCEGQPEPYMYNDKLGVKEVKHVIFEHCNGDVPMVHHGIEVILAHPY